ncbi:MAG: protein kinase domain-containing protein, partial [Longimicrobiales bacterium]
ILPVHDSGETGGTLFFVMPFVEGESLRERLEREGRIAPDEAVRLVTEIADALAYAHARGIVHRDIKPENVLIASGHAVVADFGLARALGQDTGRRQQTIPGTVVGTFAYLSPEQVSGGQADARSDQYSLAYLLYELLAGEPAYSAPSMQELMAQRLTADPPSIRALHPDVPAPVDQAIRRALSRDPAARFADVTEFARALRRSSAFQPVTGRIRWLQRRVRERPLVATAGALALVAGLSLVPLLRPNTPVEQRAWIILADFDNATGDSVFNRTLDAALLVGLQQSRYVNVYPRARIQQVLSRVGAGEADRGELAETRAREVARREGIRAVVTSAIHVVDSAYMISLRVIDARTGDLLATDARHAQRRADVLASIDELVRSLRKAIGESAEAIAKHDVPLPRATTNSLEALRKYPDGGAAWRAGEREAALELWHAA